MVGPLLGGVVYEWGEETPFDDFFFPFFIVGVVTALLAVLLASIFPNANISSDEEATAPISSVLSLSMMLDIGAIALSGSIVATLDPTLSYRLGKGSSFDMSSTMVGVWFMISSIVYVIASVPVGWLVDRHKDNSCVFKSMIAFGFFLLFLTFTFLGPLKLPGGDGNTNPIDMFDSIGWVGFAMCLKGIGSAVSVNPVYPDLVIGLPEDDKILTATISGLWNSAYAIGWALGPLIGGGLYQALAFNGFATLAAIVSLLYACVMLTAAMLGVRGGNGGTVSVEYLEIADKHRSEEGVEEKEVGITDMAAALPQITPGWSAKKTILAVLAFNLAIVTLVALFHGEEEESSSSNTESTTSSSALESKIQALINNISAISSFSISVGYVDGIRDFGIGAGKRRPAMDMAHMAHPSTRPTGVTEGHDTMLLGSGTKPFTAAVSQEV